MLDFLLSLQVRGFWYCPKQNLYLPTNGNIFGGYIVKIDVKLSIFFLHRDIATLSNQWWMSYLR